MHSKIEDKFNEMVEQANDSIEDLSELQSDEQELTYGEVQRIRKKEGKDYDATVDSWFPEPPSVRYVATDESMTKPYKDEVHNPSHYDIADTTVQELIEASFTHEELMGWLRGNILKYRLRSFKKGDNGIKDINKADEYQKFYDEYLKRNTP